MSCINFNLVETCFNNHHNTYVVNSKECLSEIYNGNGTKAWALCYFASTSYLLHHLLGYALNSLPLYSLTLTTAKQYRRLKRHIVATFSAKSGLFENHFRTFTGNLDYILINIWRKCLIKYLMQVDIPDHLKPNVFLIRASGRPTGGLYTCNSLIY